MAIDSMQDIFCQMEAKKKPFWEVILDADVEERQVTREESMARMLTVWQAMKEASDTYTGTRRSVSGLVGGDGLKMHQYAKRGSAMSGGYVSDVISEALSMAEAVPISAWQPPEAPAMPALAAITAPIPLATYNASST